jgi:hypothetical protein
MRCRTLRNRQDSLFAAKDTTVRLAPILKLERKSCGLDESKVFLVACDNCESSADGTGGDEGVRVADFFSGASKASKDVGGE